MHPALFRTRHCQHLPPPPGDHFQHNMPVRIPNPRRADSGTNVVIDPVSARSSSSSSKFRFSSAFVPLSDRFSTFIRRFETNYMRAVIYLVMSIIQWISLVAKPTSLIAAAVVLLLASLFYALAGVKGQAFVNSKTLGGQGVAQMIV